MLPNFGQAHDSFLEFKIAPPVFNSVSCSSFDNHIDWVLLERATEK